MLFTAIKVTATATPGLLVVMSKPTHPDLTDAKFNEWYTNEHLHHVVDAGMADLALRYRARNMSIPHPYLAIYRIPDTTQMANLSVMWNIPTTSKLLPGKEKNTTGGNFRDVMSMKGGGRYTRTQVFEGQIKKSGRGVGLITSTMQPGKGMEKEADEWYRKQHLDMLRQVLPALCLVHPKH